MSVLPQDCPVLVVGAGPTGLVVATRLQQLGVDTVLVDRLPERLPWSRALGIQPRSMEILDALGVAESLAAESVPVTGLDLSNQRGLLFELDMSAEDSRYSHIHVCPQSRLERILEEQYQACGGRLFRAVTLTGFVQTGAGVTASLEDAEGAVHSLACQLMIGCDGAHSTVRQQLGVGFEGVEYPDHFLLADLDVDWSLSRDRAHGFLLPSGLLLALPLPEGWRLVLQARHTKEDDAEEENPEAEHEAERGEAHENPGSAVGEPDTRTLSAPSARDSAEVQDSNRDDESEDRPDTEEDVLAAFRNRLGEAFAEVPALGEPRWMSRFSIHRRLAARYRVNRVLLAGDACHVQSPVGAQGMNTGIADASNLAWKAALFVHGHGGGRLLDTYETERRPVAQGMLRNVDLVSRTVLARGVFWRGARDSMLRLAGRSRLGNRWLRRASQLDVHYRESSLVTSGPELFASLGNEGPEPGDRLPDVSLADVQSRQPVSLQRLLREPVHHLLIQVSSALEHHEIVAAYALADRVPAGFEDLVKVHLVMPVGWPAPLHELREFPVTLLEDAGGAFRAHYGDHGALWLMRPDGHLGYRAPIGDGDHLLHYLRRFFRHP